MLGQKIFTLLLAKIKQLRTGIWELLSDYPFKLICIRAGDAAELLITRQAYGKEHKVCLRQWEFYPLLLENQHNMVKKRIYWNEKADLIRMFFFGVPVNVDLMDTNNWRPNQGAEPIMDNNDWRSQLQPESRQRIVNKIMDTLKRHLPVSGQEGLHELRKIAQRFEEKIFTAATSQPDYLRKISLKMLTMETKNPGNMAGNLPSNQGGTSNKPPDPG
ncbi:hypothetical protein Ahy_B09g094989 isoform A [Arachis hypogaea]|uniref:Mediator complex subunit 15 KIX domain-containing protein n=1 Tax=Arachis hypogaea TaxID=3818 RepID=A0A444XCS7_ARAHY|nr:hypothetical protein Ahy_B09g094989 isoform A [Arachis hypogaea]